MHKSDCIFAQSDVTSTYAQFAEKAVRLIEEQIELVLSMSANANGHRRQIKLGTSFRMMSTYKSSRFQSDHFHHSFLTSTRAWEHTMVVFRLFFNFSMLQTYAILSVVPARGSFALVSDSNFSSLYFYVDFISLREIIKIQEPKRDLSVLEPEQAQFSTLQMPSTVWMEEL